MIRNVKYEGLFEKVFWFFNFGHLFLSIFQNPSDFFIRIFKQYIYYCLKLLKEPLGLICH